jgi:hypothetical protein
MITNGPNEPEWIGCDFDATLAKYDTWRGASHTGDPVPLMLRKVKRLLDAGEHVKIFTARVHPQVHPQDGQKAEEARRAIERWCRRHLGQTLEVTHEKDRYLVQIYDDKAVGIIPNTGIEVGVSKFIETLTV